jgi:eukaryotic-like serine/threonine-protein kinase
MKEQDTRLMSVKNIITDLRIANYHITGVIGEGERGPVLQLENGDGNIYTGKFIRRGSDMPQFIRESLGLQREMKLSEHLYHPKIQTAKEVYVTQGGTFVVVKEYVPGRSLREIIDDEGQVSPENLVPILSSAVDVLAYLQDKSQHPEVGIVCHRDIKPEHIIVNDEWDVTLIDFDKSYSVNETIPYVARHRGIRRLYDPPESILYLNSPFTNEDIYALGVCAVEALFGEIPKSLSDNSECSSEYFFDDNRKKAYLLPKDIPEGLRSIIENMVHPDPKKRFLPKISYNETLESICKNDAPIELESVDLDSFQIGKGVISFFEQKIRTWNNYVHNFFK